MSETQSTSSAPKKKAGTGGKLIAAIILAIVIIAGAAYGGYYFLEGNSALTTDNVKVTASLYAITPAGGGKLRKLMVKTGDFVAKNQIIGLVENGGYLRSPIDGEIVQCDVTEGQLVGATTAVAIVADTRDIYVQANIEENNIRNIRAGQSVSVKLDAYPGQTFTGTVREALRITQTAIAGNMMSYSTSGTYTKVTQLIPVKIDISGVNLSNLIGTNATVTIKLN